MNAGIVERALRDLFAEYIATDISTADVISPVDVVHEIGRHAGFNLGRQHDAAECLRQLLHYAGLGQRLCDTQAEVADGGVVICYTPEAAQVSEAAVAIDARTLLLEATTGDGGLKRAPPALIIRINNIYEQGGEEFWVDARVEWPNEALTITIGNDAEPEVEYDVQACLVHRHADGAPVSRGMRSGHYVAYFRQGAAWYLADDSKVTRLSTSPTEFPYVVLLARKDRLRAEKLASAIQKRMQGVKKLRREAPVSIQTSMGAASGSTVVATPNADQTQRAKASGGTKRAGRVQDRSGRD